MILLVEIDVEKTEGKFVSKADLIGAIEDELGSLDVEESHYEINGVNEHACPKKSKSRVPRGFPGFAALDAIGERAKEIEFAERQKEKKK
jgi:hypothetical protein